MIALRLGGGDVELINTGRCPAVTLRACTMARRSVQGEVLHVVLMAGVEVGPLVTVMTVV